MRLEEMLRVCQAQSKLMKGQRGQMSIPVSSSVPDDCGSSSASISGTDFNFVRATEGIMRLEAGAVTAMGTIKAYEEGAGAVDQDAVGGGNVLVPGLSSVFFRYMQSRFAKVTEGLER